MAATAVSGFRREMYVPRAGQVVVMAARVAVLSLKLQVDCNL